MKPILLLILPTLFAWTGSAAAQTADDNEKVIEKIIEMGTTDNRTMEHLDILTNRFGGRLMGSDA